MGHASRMRAVLAAGAATLVAFGTTGTAAADPVSSGTASSFAATATLAGNELVPPTPVAEVTAPPFADDADETAIPIDATPLAVNGTLIAKAAVHQASDLPSVLEQPDSAQEVAGPYNAWAIGEIESLEVLVNEGIPNGKLLDADLVTAEAVAVCKAGAVQYSANSEIVNLQITDQDPLSGPLNTLIDEISTGLNGSPFVEVVDIDVNVVTKTATGAAVDALVITLLSGAGEPVPVQVRLGHAEVKDVACGGGDAPECSDTQDNDGDGVIDAQDPGCHTDGNPDNPDSYDPTDDSEAETQCSDNKDNDGDSAIDTADPGCHTDGDATNAASYEPSDDDETNNTGVLPKTTENTGALPATGGGVATGAAAALGAGALATFALRRRVA